MRRALTAIWAVLSSRALPPLVCGVFLLTYIVIAFGTEDALIALMEVTRESLILSALLALIPLNSLCRMLTETDRYLKRRRLAAGEGAAAPEGLYDEAVQVPASSALGELQSRLDGFGYRCRLTERVLAASRGVSLFPVRMLFFLASFCLFSGILISLTTRVSHRMNVIEGEPLPTAKGDGGMVEKISLKPATGAILDKILAIEVAPSAAGDGAKVFGLYPPSLYRGYFVYPRYLGVAPGVLFSAPDLPAPYANLSALNVYPPGKEDRLEIPRTPYQIIFSMSAPPDGSDPFMTGRVAMRFKLLKGKEMLFEGELPVGQEFVRDGYRLSIPECRRMVTTDFIQDYGVLLVWASSLLYLVAACLWLPVRLFCPRREMVFAAGREVVQGLSRAEGGRRKHAGVFHEALDLLELRRSLDP